MTASQPLSAPGAESYLAVPVAPCHDLGLPAQHHEAFGVVAARRSVSRLGDNDARTARNDLLDAAAGLVKLDAEMKLLDPWARHEPKPDALGLAATRTKQEHNFRKESRLSPEGHGRAR